jgi:polyhydroxybutyrate depolymerase
MKLNKCLAQILVVVAGSLSCAPILHATSQTQEAQSTTRVEMRSSLILGIPRTTTMTVGAREREYLLYVPEVADPSRKLPVVFAYHGGNGTARSMMQLTKFNEVADRESFVVVYPQGVGKSWNDGRVTQVSEAHRDNVDDLAFFDAMLQRVAAQAPIDLKRVYVTGISNGGIFSHYLAANRTDKIAAIAPVVGAIADPFHKVFAPTSGVSVLVVQGVDDKLVPYAGGGVAPGDGKDRGRVISTDDTVTLWRKANRLSAAPTTAVLPDRDPNDGCRVEATMWEGGRDGSVVWLYRVVGGGHTWPSGAQYALGVVIGRVTNDIDSGSIWAFFAKRAKP